MLCDIGEVLRTISELERSIMINKYIDPEKRYKLLRQIEVLRFLVGFMM